MQRIIKFRTWNKITKLLSDSFTFDELAEFGFTIGRNKFSKESIGFKSCIIMQFTGLKDTNGFVFEVIWANGKYTSIMNSDEFSKLCEYIDKGNKIKEYEEDECKWYDCEVIGNIYENK